MGQVVYTITGVRIHGGDTLAENLFGAAQYVRDFTASNPDLKFTFSVNAGDHGYTSRPGEAYIEVHQVDEPAQPEAGVGVGATLTLAPSTGTDTGSIPVVGFDDLLVRDA